MSYNTQLTLRAEPKDKVAIVNLEFETNMHYVSLTLETSIG